MTTTQDDTLLPEDRKIRAPESKFDKLEDEESSCFIEDGEIERGSSTHDTIHEMENTVEIGANESKAVARSKVLVYVIILAFAFAASALTCVLIRREENGEFEKEFSVLARELIKGAESRAVTIFRQLNTMSTALTSRGLDQAEENSNETWPYVVLPHFYQKTKELGILSDAEVIIFTPRVPLERVDEWSNFVQTNEVKILRDTFDPDASLGMKIDSKIRPIPPETYAGADPPLQTQDDFLPVIQYGPATDPSGLTNIDLNSHPIIRQTTRDTLLVSHPLLSEVSDFGFILAFYESNFTQNSPKSIIAEPVYRDFRNFSDIVGFVFAVEPWEAYFDDVTKREFDGFVIFVKDSCGKDMTFVIEGDDANFMGYNDLHNSEYDYLGERAEFVMFARYDGPLDDQRHCDFSLVVYPNKAFEEQYLSNEPYVSAAVVFSVFLIPILVFAFYDWMVQRRQRKVLHTAQRNSKIVQSLFPKDVGERIMAHADETERQNTAKDKMSVFKVGGNKSFGLQQEPSTTRTGDPIADLYPECTILFADIVGFTAWSSTREPKHVFTLLETIFASFDALAHRRKVFKVETIGDCYVAVVGLPNPRPDHAVVMARFARDIGDRFQLLSRQLEVDLGPETADLALRVGLHSGPVTAGVLRGERARFQLFGDTMNTASRMESTSKPQRIHLSQETADLLIAAGKSHWILKRPEQVEAKGKGKLQTYWLVLKSEGPRSSSGSGTNSSDKLDQCAADDVVVQAQSDTNFPPNKSIPTAPVGSSTKEVEAFKEKTDRLVRWNVAVLSKLLRDLQTRRHNNATAAGANIDEAELSRLEQSVLVNSREQMVLDEVQDIIKFPGVTSVNSSMDGIKLPLDAVVMKQLQDYVETIASMYHDIPFHNFEHASHATMSVVKFMSRIAAIAKLERHNELTFGITSDPLTQFACAFSAVIHDLDHSGVPNATLVQNKAAVARAYNNRSVAEQNSVVMAWSLLMDDRFRDFRRTIYTTPAEFKLFRQLVVNLVMATDIMDEELAANRKKRWEAAFCEDASAGNASPEETLNRKATIVLERLIQASDVSHTMQHWQIYMKWNERLFMEMFRAYRDGRSETDPTNFWNNSEVRFSQNITIPLAKNLQECGVFGDEYLNYAMQNAKEWHNEGPKVVAEFRETAIREYGALEEVVQTTQ